MGIRFFAAHMGHEDLNRNSPVDCFCHQFKNWWLPYDVPTTHRQRVQSLAHLTYKPWEHPSTFRHIRYGCRLILNMSDSEKCCYDRFLNSPIRNSHLLPMESLIQWFHTDFTFIATITLSPGFFHNFLTVPSQITCVSSQCVSYAAYRDIAQPAVCIFVLAFVTFVYGNARSSYRAAGIGMIM